MWANSVWGFFGLTVTFTLAALGLPAELVWLRPWFLGAAATCFVASMAVLMWPLSKGKRVAPTLRRLRIMSATTVGILLIALGAVIVVYDAVQSTLDRYVRPRVLTEAQFEAIKNYLLPHDHFRADVYFTYPDRETEEYSARIMLALHAGGWDSDRRGVEGKMPTGESIQQGLALRIVYGPNFPGGTPKKVRLLQEAFAKANVPIPSSYGTHNATTVANGDAEVQILVGKRPMVVE